MMRTSDIAALVSAGVLVAGCVKLLANNFPTTDLESINRLDAVVQYRFQDPVPATLGLSRIARPSSFGAHFRPVPGAVTDFVPERDAEREAIAGLEYKRLQVGLYLVGAAITWAPAASLNYRALKGPAVMTPGTPRPAWYPATGLSAASMTTGDSLPDWNTMYPLASKAMRSFQDSGRGFETMLDGWNIAVRPVVARDDRCVGCHDGRPSHVAWNDSIGGVIYVYRRSHE